MPRDETLSKIRAEIEGGDLGKARDRLHGLISMYPGDCSLRQELGSVYWKLRDAAMAGRYWFLTGSKSPEMQEAVAAFERFCGASPARMLRALKIRAPLESIEPRASRELYAELLAHAEAAPHLSGRPQAAAPTAGQRALQLGCMVLLALFLLLAVIGLLTVARGFR